MQDTGASVQFSRVGRGTREPVIAQLMAQALERPGLLSLAAGFTDNEVLPMELVQQAVAELAASGKPEFLQYGSNQGRAGLREMVAHRLLSEPGETATGLSAEHVTITNGSQQALYLLAQVLCDPGDIVLVEQPTYFVFLELLKALGVEALSLPATPDGGVDVDASRALIRDLKTSGRWARVRFTYLVTYYSNPSSRSMLLSEKCALGRLLQEQAPDLPVVEDAAYRLLYFDAPADAPSIFSLPEFEGLPRVYLGTFSKSFASGLKTGYLISDHKLLLRTLMRVKGHHDFGTPNFNQAILEHLMRMPAWDVYLLQLRQHYAAKAATMNAALEASGLRESGWSWERPGGGLLFWLRGPEGFDARVESPFCTRCLERSLLYVPGDLCFAEGEPYNFVRLALGAVTHEQIREGVHRFAEVARNM